MRLPEEVVINGKLLAEILLCHRNMLQDARGVKRERAILCGADLSDVDLRGADLSYADLSCAFLFGADLCGTTVYNTCWHGANLYGAKNVPYIPMTCPEEGAFIGWKKSRDNSIIKLWIPEDAKRSSACGRKCRCDKAEVLSIQTWDGRQLRYAESNYNRAFKYEVGKTVSVDYYEEDRWVECAPGIHFFINRQEAVDYIL